MLLKFSNPDLLDTTLIEPSTGSVSYTILTRPHFIRATGSSYPPDSPASDCTSSSSSATPSPSSSRICFDGDEREQKRTFLMDASGTKVLAEIGWLGSQPTDIVIGNERLENVKELFGSMGLSASSKVFSVSTRFEPEYYWIASADSLTLHDNELNKTKGRLHHSSLLLGSKFVPVSPILPVPVNDYLEFESNPLVSDEEIIVTFILMEALRQNRFCNTQASQQKMVKLQDPKAWLVKRAGQRLRAVSLGRRKALA